jgi:hypothetical protein
MDARPYGGLANDPGQLSQPSLRFLPDPLQRVVLLLKAENRIDFAAAPENAYGVTLPDPVLPDNE